MSNIKLVHSGGNSVSLTTPTSNPASNITFKLPQADGSAGQVLQTDGSGNLTFVNPGGISFSQQWRLTSNKSTSSTSSDISANLEVVDSDGYGGLGGTMTQSSGIFTFPSTGIYLILAKGSFSASGGATSNYNEMDLHTTTDNSTFNRAAIGWCYIASGGYGTAACDFMFDVTNTSTHKVKFRGASASSNAYLTSNTNDNQTHFTFIRLGDT
jgi:filamentous hemagglutinin family protein